MPADPSLSESEARALLDRAGDTIDVDPVPPLALTGLPEPPAGSRWPVLVAAAAAVLLVALAGTYLVAHKPQGSTPQPVGQTPVETAHHLGAHQMPAVIGLSVQQARRLLEARGLRVEARRDNTTCAPAGTVMLSHPAVGAHVGRGSVVRLSLSVGNATAISGLPIQRDPFSFCRGRQAAAVWRFVRFAGYHDSPNVSRTARAAMDPSFASTVRLTTPGSSGTISAQEAIDPGQWELCSAAACHSPLGALAEMLTRPFPGPSDGPRTSPYVFVEPAQQAALGQEKCAGFGQLAGMPDKTYAVWLYPPGETVEACQPPPLLAVHLDDSDAISGVDLLTASTPQRRADDDASRREEALRAQSARTFAAWVRGRGPAPRFAASVRYLVGDHQVAELTATEAANKRSWRRCPSSMSAPCSMPDPLSVIDADWHSVAVFMGRTEPSPFCRAAPADLPADLEDRVADDMAELSQGEPKNCGDAYAVEVWIDSSPAIYAVNLAVIPRKGPLPKP